MVGPGPGSGPENWVGRKVLVCSLLELASSVNWLQLPEALVLDVSDGSCGFRVS